MSILCWRGTCALLVPTCVCVCEISMILYNMSYYNVNISREVGRFLLTKNTAKGDGFVCCFELADFAWRILWYDRPEFLHFDAIELMLTHMLLCANFPCVSIPWTRKIEIVASEWNLYPFFLFVIEPIEWN